MPIISRTLDKPRPQRDGRVRVLERAVSSVNVVNRHGYLLTVSNPVVVQDFLLARAPFDEANLRFTKAQNKKDTAGMAAALADVELAKIDMQPAYDAIVTLARTEAEAAMDVRDWTTVLEDWDFAELLVWVKGLNTVATFNFTGRDITELKGEEFILTWFAEHLGEDALAVAWWIESLGPPQFQAIRNRVGYDQATGSRIQDRAIALLSVVNVFDTVEDVP